jgi:non-heme chloroperoxidase
MDTYTDDLAELVHKLELKNAVHVGHSTGGGEVARYIRRHGAKRVSKAVLIAAVPPIMVKSPSNPGGTSIEVLNAVRDGTRLDRSAYFKELAIPFYGYNRPGATATQGVIESFWLQGMMGGLQGLYDCVNAFSETDYSEDLKQIDVPTLILQGDDDQIVPFTDASPLTEKLVKGSILKVYPGAPHGPCTTMKDNVSDDLLDFIKA